mmetsp:Transcript_22368/g.36595  ORF Transcript_22368/g.36595 Transcript_22368/m.36595 type:complete len:192 (-) Transcript_22368:149-724(-)
MEPRLTAKLRKKLIYQIATTTTTIRKRMMAKVASNYHKQSPTPSSSLAPHTPSNPMDASASTHPVWNKHNRQSWLVAMRQHGFHSMRTVEARLKEYFVDEVEMEAPPTDLPVIVTEENLSMEKERCASGGLLKPDQKMKDTEKDTVLEETNGKKRKSSKLLCARPFGVMRGHTAFLTFATAGLAPRPDPNA